jgi:hypothetical protein
MAAMSDASAPDRTARSSASLWRLRLKSTSSYRQSRYNDNSRHKLWGCKVHVDMAAYRGCRAAREQRRSKRSPADRITETAKQQHRDATAATVVSNWQPSSLSVVCLIQYAHCRHNSLALTSETVLHSNSISAYSTAAVGACMPRSGAGMAAGPTCVCSSTSKNLYSRAPEAQATRPPGPLDTPPQPLMMNEPAGCKGKGNCTASAQVVRLALGCCLPCCWTKHTTFQV